jgi:hypothetical protein
LIPRSSHLLIVEALKTRGDEWKATALSRDALLAEQSAQITALTEGNKTVAALLRSAAPEGSTDTERVGG